MTFKPLIRLFKQALWWIGAGLFAAGLILPATGSLPSMTGGIITGVGMALVGANILFGGDFIVGPEARTFSARGDVARGDVVIDAGLADITLSKGSIEKIATVRCGPIGKPHFDVEHGVAKLTVKSPKFWSNIARWQARLATNVLWDVNVTSTLGHIYLDLSGLRLEKVEISTTRGQIYATCPDRGYVNMHLEAQQGNIEMHIPPGTGASVALDLAATCQLSIMNERLRETPDGYLVTGDYDTAGSQVNISVRALQGTVIIN